MGVQGLRAGKTLRLNSPWYKIKNVVDKLVFTAFTLIVFPKFQFCLKGNVAVKF